ncbi:AraC family transcriptional regulator [Parathalassolituus penaei]|uniref:Helix-turn-helix transcriptional regulator n=1 Tax=Parathalassolituus penaei TaxID=2997323 RepID=A0A9X3EF99_9GAMM|nr:helix-turn-helix transcriptional regulator [Parathalassolituus penaei]MCY0966191.1 helix-turn-helix transcriptional regulator [Parathalassolituus penaei]
MPESRKASATQTFASTGRELPESIYFRVASPGVDSFYSSHRHDWGELVQAYNGSMQVRIAGHDFLAPVGYAVWIPPNTDHTGLGRHQASHSSVYIHPQVVPGLPSKGALLLLTPLLRSMLEHLRITPPKAPYSPEEKRFLQVLVDQLGHLPVAGSYLPGSDDPLLQPLLQHLQQHPDDNRSLAEWAAQLHCNERTLTRHCQQKLGMTLVEWKQRLRVLRALERLDRGDKVESIALELGYSSASAFIVMFRSRMGVTPDEYRRGTV